MGRTEQAGDGAVLLLTTVGAEADARRLANLLVNARLAGCVSLIHPLHSVYRWRESVTEDSEWLLLIKTTRSAEAAARERLLQEHPYETPELLAFAADHVSAPYWDWLNDATRPEVDR